MSYLSSIFAALGNKTRFEIVEHLLNKGETSAGDLQAIKDISPAALSRHLKVLTQANLLIQKVDKQRRLYSVRPQTVEAISAWTISHKEFWQSSLDRLAQALEAESEKHG